MKYLLDSDIVADALKGLDPAVALVRRLSVDGLAISVITYSELYSGILTSYDPPRAERVFRGFLRSVRVLPISRAVAAVDARIRADLRLRKRDFRHRTLDLLIAAAAIHHQLTLVTRNKKDYTDITGLALYPL